jgi:hypothetical protein
MDKELQMDDRSLWMMAQALPSRLRTLSTLLDKGAAFAEAKGLPFEALSQAQLAPDMFPLTRQVSIACRLSWEAMALLSGRERPAVEPLGDSLAELKGRIEEAIGKLESVQEREFDGAAQRRIVLPLQGEMTAEFSGPEFLRDWSLPNVYFHLATAYDILRHKGVELGKADFMAHIAPNLRGAG